MIRRVAIIAFFFLGAVFWWIYETTKLPPGVHAKGPDDWMPWISLVGTIVSIVSGVVTTIIEVLRHRKK